MEVITGSTNVEVMLRMYDAVRRGNQCETRGTLSREIRDVGVVFHDTAQPPLTSFRARKFNLRYAKREWLWYLGADRYDDSIEKYATMWQKLKQDDGSFNSNYGQYIFAEGQFDYVHRTLLMDPDSRRASIVLLKSEHLYEANIDVVCTYAINFSIRARRLHMTVMMRSNDVIFGFTNDSFCFWNLMEFMYQLLSVKYPDLRRGTYTHFVNSLHVYERHFDMIDEIVTEGEYGYKSIQVPLPDHQEVSQLVLSKGRYAEGEYYSWLTSDQ